MKLKEKIINTTQNIRRTWRRHIISYQERKHMRQQLIIHSDLQPHIHHLLRNSKATALVYNGCLRRL